jgi:hypothetical protein
MPPPRTVSDSKPAKIFFFIALLLKLSFQPLVADSPQIIIGAVQTRRLNRGQLQNCRRSAASGSPE